MQELQPTEYGGHEYTTMQDEETGLWAWNILLNQVLVIMAMVLPDPDVMIIFASEPIYETRSDAEHAVRCFIDAMGLSPGGDEDDES